jgi:Icc-related predicted phosphoesterase
MKIKHVSGATARNFKMRLCHVSDTHGGFPRLYGRYDVIVHTGDLFPNSYAVSTGNRTQEMMFQDMWLKDNINNFKSWLQGHPFLYVPGNHDFLHPDRMEHILRGEGINVVGLTDKLATFQGVNFYGFPYVPYINGAWNYERQLPEMQQESDKMVAALNQTKVDILCCHAPLYGVLDLNYNNESFGSTVIANALDYKIAPDMIPDVLLFGHIHEAAGIAMRNGLLCSNAATTYQIIEI